jgi:hypothetical protein
MKKTRTKSGEPTDQEKTFSKQIKTAAQELAKDIKDATAFREELNPNVILTEGWTNFLGSVEKNMEVVLPVVLEYLKTQPELLAKVLMDLPNPMLPVLGAYKSGDGLEDDKAIRDMVTDIVHLCDKKELNIYNITNRAVDVAKEEDELNCSGEVV